MMCAEASQTLAHVRAGKMKAFVVMSQGPLGAAAGHTDDGGDRDGHADPVLARAVGTARACPRTIVAKLNAAVVTAFADPAVQKRITDLGQTIPTRDRLTPEALAAYHQAEIDKWWPIIRAANIKVQ